MPESAISNPPLYGYISDHQSRHTPVYIAWIWYREHIPEFKFELVVHRSFTTLAETELFLLDKLEYPAWTLLKYKFNSQKS